MTWRPVPQDPCPCKTCTGENEPPAPTGLTAEQRRILDSTPASACGHDSCGYCGTVPYATATT
jgi:hypothetical protein